MAADSLHEYVLDQLAELGTLRCSAMFGGYGLYRDGLFFAILYKGRLYFKTDAKTRGRFIECGMRPFQPAADTVLKNYYEVPADVMEDASTLAEWARRALAVQAKQKSPAGVNRKRARRRAARRK